MIDLTPLDVRKKRGDFRKLLRGYDPEEVDTFLELAAERLEELVKENLTLTERAQRLGEQVEAQGGREKAVHEALVTAQELRADIRDQAGREADLLKQQAEVEVARALGDADRRLEEARSALGDLERHRVRFLKGFRALLERELDAVQMEESREPVDRALVEVDLSRSTVEEPPGEEDEDARAEMADPEDEGDPESLLLTSLIEDPQEDESSWGEDPS